LVREKGLEDYIIEELVKRGWKYVDSSSLGREDLNKPLLNSVLKEKIREFNPGISEDDISGAISILETRSNGPKGCREVLEYLKFGIPIKLSKTMASARLKLIDYKNINRNEFVISRQVTHLGFNKIVNDKMLYVNGIPLVNIEVKNPTNPSVSWIDAFHQIKRYEQDVPELYKYVQIGVAIESTARYFPILPWAKADTTPLYEWKEEGLDAVDSTIEMLRPERLLDILKFFTYFRMEEGRESKVIARYMQYRAANKIVERVQNRLRERESVNRGLIWHWQGSGKTLTMIFAAMKLYWLLENNPIIFFVVDRLELQNQLYYENLTKLDLGPEVKPKLVENIERLKEVLSYKDYEGEPGLFVVTIQKFLPKEFDELEKILLEAAKSNPGAVINRRDVIVMVDEAHRTQYGVLAEQMMRILRKANYFAFTGTPVPRKNPKKNTFSKFSPPDEPYLDKYFILDSIDDGNTVKITYKPAPYEYRLDRELLEKFMESELDELPDEVKSRIEQRIGEELDIRKFKLFLEKPDRIDKIAKYIADHFRSNVDGKFKSMVVASSRKACILYKRALDRYLPSEYSEVVMTFLSNEKDDDIESYRKELLNRYMMGDPKDAVQKIIEKFRTEDNPKILIVTDMLITGFDAPILQTIYLDKPLKGHRLLQAIARVNRPYQGVKEYGLVIDFVGVFAELEKAFSMYEKEDLKGAVFDSTEVLSEFRDGLQQLLQLVGPKPNNLSEENLFKHVRSIAESLAKNRENERKFIDSYRRLRKIYEFIAPELSRMEKERYKWLTEIYVFYMKSFFQGYSTEDELVNRYFKKTIEAISQSIKVLEKEADFSPITIDRKFFEEFIQNRSKSEEEKVSLLIMGIVKFKQYDRNDPVYMSLADKVEALLEEWRKRQKKSIELYQDAKSLWEEIYDLKEEQAKLNLKDRDYVIYHALVDAGFSKNLAENVARELISKISDKISIPNWSLNPKLEREVEKEIALTIYKEAKGAGLTVDRMKKLVEVLTERVINVG